ncbi:MAG: BON domain-containing protein [Sterolibacterium sp.]|jgi:osmotically-inducible protein OsmY|nr:BON domain-containing protein [Sterolibacterium sp.]
MKLRLSTGFNTRLARWLLLAALTPTLTGCFGAAVVGVSAGALMVADRRPAETYLTDEGIEVRSSTRLTEKFGDRVHVNITSYNRSALLTGEVPSVAVKAEVEKAISAVPNLKAISNELQVAGHTSLSSRSNDTFITSKVKARFVDANKFAVNHVKVVTEAATVYLLGLVTREEADAAVEVARTTGGVQRVVRVFEVVSAQQAYQLDNQPGVQRAPESTAKSNATQPDASAK